MANVKLKTLFVKCYILSNENQLSGKQVFKLNYLHYPIRISVTVT